MADDDASAAVTSAPSSPSKLPGFWLVWSVLAILVISAVVLAITRPAWRFEAHPDPLPDMRLDLNSASADELRVLPGIGPNLSERIVADRNGNGPFASIDELQRVYGIGERTIEAIRPYVLVELE